MMLLLLLCVSVSVAERVLVIPMPFTSHTRYHTNVARALVDKGHQVNKTTILKHIICLHHHHHLL